MVNFFISILILATTLTQISSAQLTQSDTRTLLQIQQILEYPQVLQGWNNRTAFCYLPQSPSLRIVCSKNRITELTVIGNKTSPSQIPKTATGHFALSGDFSIDTFFTVLTKLSDLKVLSLVSLGLWGPLPAKINRLWSLEVLNISSNFISGEVPASVASFRNLTSLVLADNMLTGNAPDLEKLVFLENLDLSYNQLGPKFPSLSTNLVSFVLRNNLMRYGLPYELKNFDRLQKLDVSSNKFVGPILSSLFSLKSIQYLILAENRFSGSLPMNLSCSKNLTFVDISHNLLTGKLPTCIESNSSKRTVLSSWNCFSSGSSKYQQHAYTYCQNKALAVKPPVKKPDEHKKATIKVGAILGIIGGIVGIFGVLMLLVFAVYRRSEAKKDAAAKTKAHRSGDKNFALSSPINDYRHVPKSMRLPAVGLPPYHVFTIEDMEDATNNFDTENLIVDGSQAQLYKGSLRDGSVVLVKCQKFKQKHTFQGLQQYVEVISKLRHQHLVSALGHCIATYQDDPNRASTVFIVLEHVSKGSLRDHLQDWRRKEVLKWPQRMAISIGIARGLQFLHTSIAPGIFGNNLKIENILLDKSLTAKISNYNTPLPSKMGLESTLNVQNLGSAENGEKDDIYQLGRILLEVITGKQVNSESELSDLMLQLEKSLTETAAKLRGAVDSSLQGTYAYQSLRTAVEITVNCLSKEPSNRPSIEDVLWNLQYSIQVQEGWTSSGSLSTHR